MEDKMVDKKRILLIDDEEDFCFFTKNNLEKTGEFEVTYTTDPDEGIKIARKGQPDLILLDIRMPRKDGFIVLEELKKDDKTIPIPVIMLTAVAEEHAKIEASRLYSEDYITKPVDMQSLKAQIDKVLKRVR